MRSSTKYGLIVCLLLLLATPIIAAEKKIYLQSGELLPSEKIKAVKIAPVQRIANQPLMRVQKTLPKQAAEAEKEHVIIQLDYVPTKEEKTKLRKQGITLLEYIPDNAWVATVDSSVIDNPESDVTFISRLGKEDKMLYGLLQRKANLELKSTDGLVKIKGGFFSDLTKDYEPILSKYSEDYLIEDDSFIINVSEDDLDALASEENIKWISDQFLTPKRFNNVARQVIGVNAVQASPYNLTGLGVVAAEWDGGWAGNHTDLNGRVTIGDSGSSIDDHATHVSGTMLGSGALNQTYKGMAPNASLITFEWAEYFSEFNTEYNLAINTYDAVVSQNSWGYGPNPPSIGDCDFILGSYIEDSVWTDNATRGSFGKKITVIWSAGNQRATQADYCGSLGYTYNSTPPPGTSKNVITVGSIDSNFETAEYSSWGPTDDGRLKPDVVADGEYITSTVPQITQLYTYPYDSMRGTSMAAPGVSGVALLLYEHFRNLHSGSNPSSELIKNLIIHTARDINETGPDFVTGYGVVNATKATEYITDDISENLLLGGNMSSSGESDTYQFEVPEEKSELKITLVWNDYPGAQYAAKELVNDLDLIVLSPTGERKYPWTLSLTSPSAPAVQNTEDHLNNVEQAYISGPQSGTWTVIVNASVLPYTQEYSLITSTNDGQAPRINATSPQNQSTYQNPVTINYTVSDANMDSCWLINTSGQEQALGSCENITLPSLPDGTYNITIYANDTFGNTANSSTITFDILSAFSVEASPPNLTYRLPFGNTWYLLSIPVQLQNNSVANVFFGINSSYQVWSWEGGGWKSYISTYPNEENLLRNISADKGYWIKAAAGATFSVSGNISPSTDISLAADWNLIGYPRQNNSNVTNITSDITGSYQVWSWDDGWSSFISAYPEEENTLANFELGRGYWLKPAEAQNLTILNG